MGLKEKLYRTKEKLQKQLDHGREVSRQIQDERIRRKKNKLKEMKPSARRAITEGLMLRKSPFDVMKEEYSRRKYERQQKNKDKDN